MYQHHEESVQKVINFFKLDPDIEALLLSGSIAHGFESINSDIDIMILISDQLYEVRAKQKCLTYVSKELCTYPDGYVDGKYISINYLNKVAKNGSEPARFAFEGNKILFTKNESLPYLLKKIVEYPQENKEKRIIQFNAQLEAWFWYFSEAIKKNNNYLLWLSVSKLILFGGRLILIHNELLYPYHKWFLHVLNNAPEKPDGLMKTIDNLYNNPTIKNADQFYNLIKGFRDWGKFENGWSAQFLIDSEQNWITGKIPVDDL